MTKITLDAFCEHWVHKGQIPIVSQFQLNVFNFTTIAGNYSKRFFKASFLGGGFYGSGQKWQPRESRWGKKYTHEILVETGSLKEGIEGKPEEKIRNTTSGRKKILRRGAEYTISTNEHSSRKKKRYFNYAAVHNSDPTLTNFTVNQYSGKKPVQRQFIGFSKRLDADIEKFTHILFKGFPGNAER